MWQSFSLFLICFHSYTDLQVHQISHGLSIFEDSFNSLNDNMSAPFGSMLIGFKNVQNSKMCEISYNILK